jgi:DNA-binding GntR family transcriptional regulator
VHNRYNMSLSPPAPDRVYAHVKAGILGHRYPAGELLTEGELATEVGVSRTPVREALLRLEAEGLLRLYPKRGALVVPVTADEARNVLEARAVIEAWAAPRAVAAGAALVTRLEPLFEQMRAHCRAGDTRPFVEADRAFHEAVVDSAGNAILSRLYTSLRDRQLCMSEAAISAAETRMATALGQHEALLAALRDGDAETFTARTAEHVETAAAHGRDAS